MLTYRTAGIEDIPLLVHTRIAQLDDEEPHPVQVLEDTLTSWFTQVIQEDRLYQILIEEEGNLIACGAFLEITLPPGFFNPTGRIAYITNMYTSPAYRRRGYASKILEKLKEEVMHRDIELMVLEASPWAEKLYRDFGFENTDYWMEYRLKLWEY